MIFSQHDLAWIDNILPEKEKKESDRKKKRRKDVHENTDEEVGMVSHRQKAETEKLGSAWARGGFVGGLGCRDPICPWKYPQGGQS